MEYSTPSETGTFDARSVISLVLASDIRSSVRSGYVKPLDTSFMAQLKRPRTRVLFRILDAARYDPNNPDVRLDTIERGVLEWGDQCKINTGGRAWLVLKTLAASHEELIKRGYLREVVITGRGKSQCIRYEFVKDYVPMDPVIINRFRRYGVADGVARKLFKEHGRAFLAASMDRFEWLLGAGVLTIKKSKAAALLHLIAHPDDYPYPPASGSEASRAEKGARPEWTSCWTFRKSTTRRSSMV
ncbi:hypothetical protein ACFSC4_25815 [Deinococcus malanensis]|uniref:hypothetical protein n=1 Tax=Deinococcus malanensis TaxID=1706855 RepID=UPI00364046AA